jgi:hypothetical protein
MQVRSLPHPPSVGVRVVLKCQCCGFEEDLDPEAAFQAGWDCPPHFKHTACPLCPGVCVVLGRPHTKAHALWEKEGRPAEFTIEKCATDDTIGNPKALNEAKAGMAAIDAFLDATGLAVTDLKADMLDKILKERH